MVLDCIDSDLCILTYYGSFLCLSKNFVMHSCAKTGLYPIQEYPLVLEWGRYQSTEKSERHPAHFYSKEGVVATDK